MTEPTATDPIDNDANWVDLPAYTPAADAQPVPAPPPAKPAADVIRNEIARALRTSTDDADAGAAILARCIAAIVHRAVKRQRRVIHDKRPVAMKGIR